MMITQNSVLKELTKDAHYELSSGDYLYYFKYLGTDYKLGTVNNGLHRIFHYYTVDYDGDNCCIYNEAREWRVTFDYNVIRLSDEEVIDKILMVVI